MVLHLPHQPKSYRIVSKNSSGVWDSQRLIARHPHPNCKAIEELTSNRYGSSQRDRQQRAGTISHTTLNWYLLQSRRCQGRPSESPPDSCSCCQRLSSSRITNWRGCRLSSGSRTASTRKLCSSKGWKGTWILFLKTCLLRTFTLVRNRGACWILRCCWSGSRSVKWYLIPADGSQDGKECRLCSRWLEARLIFCRAHHKSSKFSSYRAKHLKIVPFGKGFKAYPSNRR